MSNEPSIGNDMGTFLGRLQRRSEEWERDPERRRKDEARSKHEAEIAAVRRRLVADLAVSRCDIPELALEALAAGLIDTAAVRALLAGPPGIVVLSGGVGCGKSVAAASWLASWARETGRVGRWTTGAEISRLERFRAAAVDAVFAAPRLVIDDLGAEYMDQHGAYLSLLDELVNERYSRRRPTVITTNLNAAAFRARYGERIADRIREVGRFESVDAPSMRKRP